MTSHALGAQLLGDAHGLQHNDTTLDIQYINSVIDKLSINNLINILNKHDVSLDSVRLVPQLSTASAGSTMLGIYKKKNLIYIEINIFKIDIFSELENSKDNYINKKYYNLSVILEHVLNDLTTLYVLGSEKLLRLLKHNYNSLINNSKMICFINGINQELCEDYPASIVNCKRGICIFHCKPNIVGKSFVNDIYLGSLVKLDSYVIEIELVLMSCKNKNKHLSIIRNRIKRLAAKMINEPYEIKFICSFLDKTPKKNQLHIGSHTL